MHKKLARVIWLFILGLVLLGWTEVTAQDENPLILKGELKSHPHETETGYFNLGPDTAIHAKPGSEFFQWLDRHRDKKIKVTLEEETKKTLSTLER